MVPNSERRKGFLPLASGQVKDVNSHPFYSPLWWQPELAQLGKKNNRHQDQKGISKINYTYPCHHLLYGKP